MKLLYEAMVLAIILSLVTKGSLKNLAKLEIRKIPYVFLSFGLKYGIDALAYRGYVFPPLLLILAQVLAYLLLFYFLYSNSDLPGTKLMFIGMFLNFVVIMANNGKMPVDIKGINPADAKLELSHLTFSHSIFTAQTKLPWLSDIWFQTFPSTARFSIGDVFISLGVFYLVWKTMHAVSNSSHRMDSVLLTTCGKKSPTSKQPYSRK